MYGLPYSLLPLFLLWAWIIIRPCGQLYLGILPNLTVVRGALIYFRTSESLFLHINYSACPHFCQEVDDDDLEAGGLLENFHSLTRASKVTRETMNNLKTKFKWRIYRDRQLGRPQLRQSDQKCRIAAKYVGDVVETTRNLNISYFRVSRCMYRTVRVACPKVKKLSQSQTDF